MRAKFCLPLRQRNFPVIFCSGSGETERSRPFSTSTSIAHWSQQSRGHVVLILLIDNHLFLYLKSYFNHLLISKQNRFSGSSTLPGMSNSITKLKICRSVLIYPFSCQMCQLFHPPCTNPVAPLYLSVLALCPGNQIRDTNPVASFYHLAWCSSAQPIISANE